MNQSKPERAEQTLRSAALAHVAISVQNPGFSKPGEFKEETSPRETLEEAPFFTPVIPPIPQPDFNFSNDSPSPKPPESTLS